MTEDTHGGPGGTGRRSLLRWGAGGLAVAATAGAARLEPRPLRGPGPFGSLTLATDAGSDVASLSLVLGQGHLPRVGQKRWESPQLSTSTFSMVAVTWLATPGESESRPEVLARSRTGKRWTEWTRLPTMHDRPDQAELLTSSRARVAARAGTDVMWVGRADGIQLRLEHARPDGLTLVLLYPHHRSADPLLGVPAVRAASDSADSGDEDSLQPDLISRQEWGADESLREGRPAYVHTIKQVHVHHTVNSNDYSRDDVPALIRGMLAYHTQSLGWSDIGYNFLVDRFGRCFVGRAGGPRRLVRGAHTLGFNAQSTGVSAIGNYDTARPSDAMVNAIAALAAWKLAPFDRSPRGDIRVESEGSDKFPAGRTVTLPVIDGHRDTNDTACPGRHLYDALPAVRRKAASLLHGSEEQVVSVARPASIVVYAANDRTGKGVLLGDTLGIDPGVYGPPDAGLTFRWLRGARPLRGARGDSYQIRPRDVGHAVTCEVTLTAPGLEPVTQTPTPVGPVTAAALATVDASGRGRTVRVAVSISAPVGVRRLPTGSARVQVGTRSKLVPVDGGVHLVRFGAHRPLPPGTHSVIVAYGGDANFTPTVFESTILVA